MKLLKLFLCLVAAVLMLIFAASVVGVYLYRGTPSWYRSRIATTQQTKDAANRADQKLLDLVSWAASVRAQRIRQLHGTTKPGEPPIGPKTVTLSDDELNSLLATWQFPEPSDVQQRINRYFTDGRIAFQIDAVILAGQSPEFGTLVSGEFDPVIDAQGDLHVDLTALRAGRLPIPLSAVAGRLRRLRILLQQQLGIERSHAKIDSTLTANGPAVAVAWLGLLLRAIDNRPSDPVLVIPFDMSNPRRGLPVKLTAIRVIDGWITLTVQPASQSECYSMLNDPAGDAAQ
jgi:hypothetical protein